VGNTGKLGGLCAVALTRTAALLSGVLVAAAATGVSFAAQDVALSVDEAPPTPLTIEGSISGIVPGASATLALTLRNASDAPHPVTRVRADGTGVAVGPGHCDNGYLELGEWRGAVTVPARGTATVTLPVAISAGLPAECATVVWGLLYTAY
jgi:hypothetical protein